MQITGERSDPDAAVQYVYTENSYEPLARIDSRQQHAELYWYHTEINGLPEKVTDSHGEIVWRGTSTAWGRSQHERVYAEWDVPQNLRFQGQYLDRETGLHYNTFRYYDPTGGCYTRMDPIGLAGGLNTYTYVVDPLGWVDPLGLTPIDASGYSVYGLFDPGAKEPYYIGITNDIDRRMGEHVETGRLTPGSRLEALDRNVTYGEARGYEQYYIERYKTRTGIIGEEISSGNRGNKYNSFDHSRTDSRANSFKTAYNSKKGISSKGKCI